MTDAALLARVERLEAIEAVRALIGRYATGADRRNDPAIMQPLFADDAVWEARGFGRCEGAAAIAAHLADIGRRQITWSLHLMGAPWIELAAGASHGRCRWHLWELATMRGDDEGAPDRGHWIGGAYEAELVRTDAGWRFRHLLLELSLLSPCADDWQRIGVAAH